MAKAVARAARDKVRLPHILRPPTCPKPHASCPICHSVDCGFWDMSDFALLKHNRKFGRQSL